MTTKDKVAMILTKYGYSLDEGMKLYDELSPRLGEIVKIDRDHDCVVWMECGDDTKSVSLTVWTEYESDFCLSYALAGAVVLHDPELDLTDDETAKFMEFFKLCQKASSDGEELPDLPDDMAWIFTRAALTDYVSHIYYDVSVNKKISVKLEC